jgi:hypothetical protein
MFRLERARLRDRMGGDIFERGRLHGARGYSNGDAVLSPQCKVWGGPWRKSKTALFSSHLKIR